MNYNDINQLEVILEQGIYKFDFGAIETTDPSDLLIIEGDKNWQWSIDGINFSDPLFGNNNSYYADEVTQGLTLTIIVNERTEFTIATDDQFTYGYYADEPSNPTIDLTINELVSNEFIEDSIGNVNNDIISTDTGSVTIAQLENDFFRTNLPYGVEGSGGLIVTNPSPNLVSVNWQEDNGEVFFWNGIEAISLDLTQGDNQLLLNPVSDEWGFIVTDKIDGDDVNELTINSVELVNANYSEDYVNVFSLGDVNEVNLLANSYEIATGTGDRAVSTIGNNLMGDKTYLSSLGTEGSYFKLTGLDNGVYSFDVNQLGKIDANNNDSLYVWNGKDLTKVADNHNGVITNSVDVIYGELSFIALDSETKTGTTEFTIANIDKQNDLSYNPPERIDLIPDNYLGDVDFYPNQTRVNNGTGDRAVSTLSNELGIDLTNLGTEGSYATWNNLDNGIYEITYSLYASEDDFDNDKIYFYDGNDLSLFERRSQATIQSSSTRWISESITQQVEVTNGELTFLTLDTVDKSGTTQLRINSIEKLASSVTESNPYEYIYQEPPYPIPANNKDLDLNLGILKPWETDDLTGVEYNQGYVYPSYHLGASYISEYIGGDDLSDRVSFTLNEDSYINFYHSNAIAEIINSANEVVVGSSDSYSGNLQAFLNEGSYAICLQQRLRSRLLLRIFNS